ncbi:immunoglobulin superfamily member 3-like isoform X2 [Rhinoraja longicauda]
MQNEGLMANTRLIQSPGALVLREGETAEIRCVLNSSNERNIVNKFVVHWYNSPRHSVIKLSLYSYGSTYRSAGFSERFQLSRDVASNSYSLTIREVVISDSADYICGIWGEIFGNGTQLNVTIANPPILIQLPRLERVTEGHTARLRCSMENAEVGSTDVHWYRELPGQDMEWVLTHEAGGSVRRRPGFTERFQPFRDASNSSFTLTVTNVTLNDSAAYYCTVWGDIRGNGTQLNVTSPLNDPVLIQSPSVSKVSEGVTVQLQCALHNAIVNDTDVHWNQQRPGNKSEWVMSHFVDGNVIRSGCISDRFKSFRNAMRNSYILTIANVSINDTAVYSCSVWSYIYGAGSQLNVTEPYEKLSLKILGSIVACVLVFVLLFSILAIAVCYLKKWVCFQFIFKPEGSSTEDLNTVHSTVTVETKTNTKPATNVTMSAESEVFYADIQFARRNTKAPTIEVSEETTEYAAIKRA